ncbi:unnamed protein product [marine sediment metagenome]|uniref:Uncharacterized protein n=1 Tax=marine sediment metagenome TaxID=412755 RepID=X1ETH6_9ZZZZ
MLVYGKYVQFYFYIIVELTHKFKNTLQNAKTYISHLKERGK